MKEKGTRGRRKRGSIKPNIIRKESKKSGRKRKGSWR